MKRLTFLTMAVLLAVAATASPVPENTARRVAYHFLVTNTGVELEELQMVYSQNLPKAGHPAFYVFGTSRAGFAIVAGDNVARPILAYSYENPFPSDVPENVVFFLSDITGEIDAALAQNAPISHETTVAWELLISHPAPIFSNAGGVGPLLTTQWSQHPPYNSMCPGDTAGNAKVGCGAIALGQLLRFWQYPVHPRWEHSYTESNFGYHGLNFDSVSYNYSLMPHRLNTSSSMDSIFETARFLYHVGVSVNMNYGIAASGVFAANIASALINHFKFSPLLGEASRSEYEDTTWTRMLRENLEQQHPIIYRGANTDGTVNVNAHIWVCDGYDSAGLFHFNFGWNGTHDGYYSLNAITPSSANYTYAQAAVLGIVPDSLSQTARCLKAGTSKYIVSDTINVYKQRTLNAKNGYGYTGYAGNGNRHTMIFIPSDSTKQLKIEILDSSYYRNTQGYHYLSVYDGENKDARIDGPYYPQPSNFPMVSSRNAFVIVDSSSTYTHSWAFRITMTSNVIPTYTVNVVANNSTMGSVTGGGVYAHGDTAVLEAFPNAGFRFLHWNDGNADNPRSVVVVSDQTFTAFFEAIPIETHTVSVLPNDATMGAATGGGTYTLGDTAVMEAFPNAGFRFLHWNDGNADNPRSVVVVSDQTFTAFFEAIPIETHTLSVLSNDATMGAATGGGTYTHGDTAVLEAFPNAGFRFLQWNDGNADNPRSVVVVSDQTYTAFFEAIPIESHTITVLSGDETMGAVWGGGIFQTGEETQIAAIAHDGYIFEHWNDGNPENPRTITVTADATYVAYFARRDGIDAVADKDVLVYSEGRKIHVLGVGEAGEPVCIFDMMGRCLAATTTQAPGCVLEVPQPGIYLVRIGTHTAIKTPVLQ